MKKIVCIDIGHGGKDPGACAQGAKEKDITLQIGLQLRDELARAGFDIILTRDNDKHLGETVAADLRERCRISNAAGADVFLSIHVNAGGGRGAEIYVYGDGGPVRPLAQAIVTNVATITGLHGASVRDGGPNGTGFAVICNTEADAMLLEIGFIDSDDLPKIQARIREFAPLIARAFCNFYGVPYPEQKTTPALTAATVAVATLPLSAMYEAAPPPVRIALNFAANTARRAAGQTITVDHGQPDADAADKVAKTLSALWHATERDDVRAVYSLLADALRDYA